jgi:hypothetical protein
MDEALASELIMIRLGVDERFTWSTWSAVCCITTIALFPSGCVRIRDIFRQLTKDGSRTINDLCYLAIDSLHPSVDANHPIIDTFHSIVDTTSGLQNLRRSHLSLLLRQLIQPLQSVLNIGTSDQLSQIFF